LAVVVVAIHSGLKMSIHNEQLKLVAEYAESLPVPLFFCITGYLLEEKLSHNCDEKRKIIVANLKKYVRIYAGMSTIYIPLTIYGIIQEIHGNANLYVTAYNLIKNYLLVGEQFYSWQLWYLLATIWGMAFVLLIPHKRSSEMLLWSFGCFVLACAISSFQESRIIELTIVNGRLFTGPSYILMGMLVKRKSEIFSKSGGIIVPILVCICSVLFKIPYSTTNIVAFLSVPWILGTVMRHSKSGCQMGISKACRDTSSIIYYSHMYFLFIWMYMLPIGEKGLECFLFVAGLSLLFSMILSAEISQVKRLCIES
jgi:surface polysaccharide O-acyltransferase-like enzyme